MSLKEESDNEAASSQIPNSAHLKEKKISWKSNNYFTNDQFQEIIPVQAQNMRNETTLTQSMPNKAQTMAIQAKNTKNAPKIRTQSQHSECWAMVKNGRVRLIDLPLTWALQNKILYGGKHKNLPDEWLKPRGPIT